MMKPATLLAATAAALALAACERTTVNNPPMVETPAPAAAPVPAPAPVPGPAGPQGAPGAQGEPGKPGDTTVIVPERAPDPAR